jgi:hypothetical protein
MVAHACNPSYSGDRDSSRLSLENVIKTLLQNKPDVVAATGGPSYSRGGGKKTTVQDQPGQNSEILFEKNKLKAKGFGVWFKW